MLLVQYELAAKYTKKFKCDRVLMGSGNHDFDHTAFLLWDQNCLR
jgi:hypothetical protein